MPAIVANGIELFYDETGSPTDPVLLLIMGYRAQMISWDDDFCRLLADRGFRVVRFDNRDCGLSTKCDAPLPQLVAKEDAGAPGPLFTLAAPAPYTLSDMAADGVGLLDALGIERAHIVGASMGGMIAQLVAINHPDRALSLASIMSSTGNPDVGGGTPAAVAALMAPMPDSRAEVIERTVETYRLISGPHFDEDAVRARAARAYDRSFYPVGALYQMAAIMADGDRSERLGSVDCATVVIHGAVDTLIGVSGGEATAKAIPGADLVIFDDMGHELPRPLWPQIAEAIVTNTARASRAGADLRT